MLIFLDFDGVLHPATARSATALFGQIPLLEAFFRQPEYVDCQFVIASTWRINHHINELVVRFSPDFQARIIGCTPVLAGSLKGSREREILAWLHDFGREHETWIALDDLHDYFVQHRHRVFFCNSSTGLIEQDLPALAAHLARFDRE